MGISLFFFASEFTSRALCKHFALALTVAKFPGSGLK